MLIVMLMKIVVVCAAGRCDRDKTGTCAFSGASLLNTFIIGQTWILQTRKNHYTQL